MWWLGLDYLARDGISWQVFVNTPVNLLKAEGYDVTLPYVTVHFGHSWWLLSALRLTIVLRCVYSTFTVSSRNNSSGKQQFTYPWLHFWLRYFLNFTPERISKVYSKTCSVFIDFCSLLGTFAELPKATIGLVAYVYLLVRMEQFGPHRTQYDENYR